MPLADYAAYKAAAVADARPWMKGFVSQTTGLWGSHIQSSVDTMTAPTTAVLCDSSTRGALLVDPVLGTFTNPLFLALLEQCRTQGNANSLFLVDRLANSGGLSGTVTTAQTTNLPTPSLPASVNKVGVMIGLQVYSALGATTTTASNSRASSGHGPLSMSASTILPSVAASVGLFM